MIHQASVARSPVDRAIDDVDATELAITTAGQKVCAKHPTVARTFCINLEQLLQIQKGQPMINLADASSETDLLNVTDEESDAAVAMFGCDCVTSINRLRHVRNQFS